MTTSTRMTYPKFKAWDPSTQQFLNGGLLYTYARGTTTNKTTYSDVGKTTANANPVVLNAYGEATIFLDGTYKFVLKDSAGTTIWTEDDINVQETGVTDSGQTAFGIIANGSFEIDSDGDGVPDNWTRTVQGTVALDNTDARHGAQSYKFTSTGSGGGYITSDFFEVSANNIYSIVFSVKSSVADIRNLVTISWYDLDKVIIAGSPVTVWDDSTTNPTSWTEKRFSVTPAAGACYAKLIMYGCHSSDATAGNTKYDYVQMYNAQPRIDTPTIYNTTTIVSEDAGASGGPIIDLYRDSASPTANDSLGVIRFSGEDSAGNSQTYVEVFAEINTATSGLEDGKLGIQTTRGGTAATRVTVANGVQIGAPADSDKGVGTLNLDNDLYKDGTNITTPAAVTNFVNGHVVYQFEDTPQSTATGFDIATNIAAAWESVGPTGSGATNIWTDLNSVPATAKAIIVFVRGSVDDGAAASAIRTAQYSLYARKNGSSAANGNATEIQRVGGIIDMNAATVDSATWDGTTEVTIPVAATAKFDLYFNRSAGTSSTCVMFLKGWVDSLI